MKRVPCFQIFVQRHKNSMQTRYPFLSASQIQAKLRQNWKNLDGLSQMSYSKIVTTKSCSWSRQEQKSRNTHKKRLKSNIIYTNRSTKGEEKLYIDPSVSDDLAMEADKTAEIETCSMLACQTGQKFLQGAIDATQHFHKQRITKTRCLDQMIEQRMSRGVKFSWDDDENPETDIKTDEEHPTFNTTSMTEQRMSRSHREKFSWEQRTSHSQREKFSWDDNENLDSDIETQMGGPAGNPTLMTGQIMSHGVKYGPSWDDEENSDTDDERERGDSTFNLTQTQMTEERMSSREDFSLNGDENLDTDNEAERGDSMVNLTQNQLIEEKMSCREKIPWNDEENLDTDIEAEREDSSFNLIPTQMTKEGMSRGKNFSWDDEENPDTDIEAEREESTVDLKSNDDMANQGWSREEYKRQDCIGSMFQDVSENQETENFVGGRRLLSSAAIQGHKNFESMFVEKDIFE